MGEDQWQVLIRDKVPAYIPWGQWEQNQQKLRENSTKFGFSVTRGTSLVAGRVVCGKCGSRMSVHDRDGYPYFACCVAQLQWGEARCQSFNARWLEPLITHLVLQALKPASVQLSMEAGESIEADRARMEKNHRQSVERTTYEAKVARRRYEEVDPSNRLVAAELENRWEASLHAQRKCEEALNRFRQERPAQLTQAQKEAITALSKDFRSLWENELTTGKDRQDLVRILIERIVVDVIDGTERLSVTVHWSGGYASQHETRRSVQSFDQLEGADVLFQRAQQLYDAADGSTGPMSKS